MSSFEKFNKLTIEYDNRLFEIFREIIDTAISYSLEERLNPLDRYVYVNNAIEQAYRELACAQGYIPSCDLPYEAHPRLSDELEIRIYDYIEPITEGARQLLQKQVDEMMNSNTLGELKEKFEHFKNMLEQKDIPSFLYEDLEIKKRV